MAKFIQEFKTFALKGNVMDLAIGVIIGTAFGKIVSSLVDNILMPLIEAIAGGADFSTWTATVGGAELKYGLFINAVIDFLIIAFVLFILVRVMNRLIRKREESKKAEDKPADIILLEEIRDLLKNR